MTSGGPFRPLLYFDSKLEAEKAAVGHGLDTGE
jgi:hypothetical protein